MKYLIYKKITISVRQYCPNTPCVLVALKCDLRDDPNKGKDCISAEQAKKFQEKIGAACYRESSAKQHKGIEEIFQLCAQIKLDPESLGIRSAIASASNSTKQQQQQQTKQEEKKGGGCLMM